MKTQVILAAAGTGTRLDPKKDKPLIPLKGKPLFVYSLEVFERCSAVASTVIVAKERRIPDFAKLVKKYSLRKVSKIVAGGARRSDSVRNGLAALDYDTDLVLVHDAARPLITPELVGQAIAAGRETAAVVVAVPVKSTIKRVNPENLSVEATLDRAFLWEIQTPQVFATEVLKAAHAEFKDLDVTDDAALVERAGRGVKVVMGSYANIKITTREDLVLAECFLNAPTRGAGT